MGLSKEDIKVIEELVVSNESVKRLYDEYLLFHTDPSLRFYKSLIECTNILSTELDSVHSGKFSRLKILDSSSTIYKRIYQILAGSKKILDGIEKGKSVMAEKTGTSVREVVSDGKSLSFTDKIANESKK